MRMTGMNRLARGVRETDQLDLSADLEEMLEHLKWNLWHGKVERALEIIDELAYALIRVTEACVYLDLLVDQHPDLDRVARMIRAVIR